MRDPVLGPGALFVLESTRKETSCPIGAGDGRCVDIRIDISADAVSRQEAVDKLKGLVPSGSTLNGYRTEEHLRVVARKDDQRVVEVVFERRTNTTANVEGRSVPIEDLDRRAYEFR